MNVTQLLRILLLESALLTCSRPARASELSQDIPADHYHWASQATVETLQEPLTREMTEPATPAKKPCQQAHTKTSSHAAPKIRFAQITTQITYLQPRAVNQLKDLEQLNPGLSAALPSLAKLLPSAKTSPKFQALYQNKARQLASGAALDFKDYFDCATVLDLQDPDTKRTAILFQSDMDSDTDGTDPKRYPGIESYPAALTDADFQPTLAYTWSENGLPPNPMIGFYSGVGESALQWRANLADQKAKAGNVAERFMIDQLLAGCTRQVSAMEALLKQYKGPEAEDDLARVRSLVGEKDPFIVVPQAWLKKDASLDFAVGDCAIVIYGGQVLPAIIGDTGPCEKCGEVSLKLAQAVNPKATANFAAVSEPCATYLVFPGTARKNHGPLDLETLHSKVLKLVGQIGGLGKDTHLHAWTE